MILFIKNALTSLNDWLVGNGDVQVDEVVVDAAASTAYSLAALNHQAAKDAARKKVIADEYVRSEGRLLVAMIKGKTKVKLDTPDVLYALGKELYQQYRLGSEDRVLALINTQYGLEALKEDLILAGHIPYLISDDLKLIFDNEYGVIALREKLLTLEIIERSKRLPLTSMHIIDRRNLEILLTQDGITALRKGRELYSPENNIQHAIDSTKKNLSVVQSTTISVPSIKPAEAEEILSAVMYN